MNKYMYIYTSGTEEDTKAALMSEQGLQPLIALVSHQVSFIMCMLTLLYLWLVSIRFYDTLVVILLN
jgi:hypothetical protein